MVYIDDYNAPFGRMIMCHMMADTPEELHAMAKAIGLDRRHFQNSVHFPHYDVSKGLKAKAIKLGATECTARDLVKRYSPRLMRQAMLEAEAQLRATPGGHHLTPPPAMWYSG